MTSSARDYASLAKDAYEDRRDQIGDRRGVAIGGHEYRIIDAQDNPSGFQATAYQRVDTGEVIIAYRGTQGLQDIAADTVMVADKLNPQEADARAFTLRVIKYAREHGIPLDQVTVTGHSLGGTLAEIEAARFGLRGATFNAYGAVDLGYDVPEGGSLVIDYVVATDVVSAASHHYGQLVPLAAPEGIAALRASGYMDGRGNLLEVARRRGLAAHSIDNFAPGTGSVSILTPEAEALARANAKPIAAYDRDVRGARQTLHLTTTLPGTPTWVLARNAEAADGLMTTGALLGEGAHAAESLAEHEAAAVKRMAARTGQTIVRTTQRVAAAVEHDAERTLLRFSDALHPRQAVYAALKARMPTDTSEERLAQCTAACHAARLDKPEDLGQVYVTRTKALFLNNSLFGHMAEVDLTRPPPPIEQSLRQVTRLNQQPPLRRMEATSHSIPNGIR